MPDLDLGLTPWLISSEASASDLGRQAAQAERWGYRSFWLPESHFGGRGSIPDPLMLLAAVAACEADVLRPTGGDANDDAPIRTYAQAWIGVYEGVASGVFMGSGVQLEGATLRIEPDADSVRSEGCLGCVTIVLDSVVALANVTVEDPVRLSLRYTRGGYRSSLTLDKFSGSGGTANVIQGRFLSERLDGAGAPTDLTYVLDRR